MASKSRLGNTGLNKIKQNLTLYTIQMHPVTKWNKIKHTSYAYHLYLPQYRLMGGKLKAGSFWTQLLVAIPKIYWAHIENCPCCKTVYRRPASLFLNKAAAKIFLDLETLPDFLRSAKMAGILWIFTLCSVQYFLSSAPEMLIFCEVLTTCKINCHIHMLIVFVPLKCYFIL